MKEGTSKDSPMKEETLKDSKEHQGVTVVYWFMFR